jgi:hypothetical protein
MAGRNCYGHANDGIIVFAVLMVARRQSERRQVNPKRMAAAVWTPAGMLLALRLNQPISATVGGPRPYTALRKILVLTQRSQDPSFPNDHAVIAVDAVMAGLFLVKRRLGALAALARSRDGVLSRVHRPGRRSACSDSGSGIGAGLVSPDRRAHRAAVNAHHCPGAHCVGSAESVAG